MNPSPLPDGGRLSHRNDGAKKPLPQLAPKDAFAPLIARSVPIVQLSNAAARARLMAGSAIAATIPMTVTTKSSSISVKPVTIEIQGAA